MWMNDGAKYRNFLNSELPLQNHSRAAGDLTGFFKARISLRLRDVRATPKRFSIPFQIGRRKCAKSKRHFCSSLKLYTYPHMLE